MSTIRRLLRRALPALAATALLSVVHVDAAGAATPFVRCTATGTVFHSVEPLTDVVTWTLLGRGTCSGNLAGTYFVDFTGVGVSDGLGVCTGDPAAANLSIAVTGNMTSFADGVTRPFAQNWRNPAATYPVATPFEVQGTPGAGFIFNRVFGQCAPNGTPAAAYDWTFPL